MAIFGRVETVAPLRPTRAAAVQDASGQVCAGLRTVGSRRTMAGQLSAMNAQTALLISHLKADLQRVVAAANGQLDEARRTGGDRSTTRSHEARIINGARAFAEQRVESTVRLLRAGSGQVPDEALVTDRFISLN